LSGIDSCPRCPGFCIQFPDGHDAVFDATQTKVMGDFQKMVGMSASCDLKTERIIPHATLTDVARNWQRFRDAFQSLGLITVRRGKAGCAERINA
jgi:hypothetical protein